MANWFYYLGYLFILNKIVFLFSKKRIIREQEELEGAISDSIQNLDSTRIWKYGFDYFKKKGLKIIILLGLSWWQLTGIWSCKESHLFLYEFLLSVVLSPLTFIAKTKSKKWEVEAVGAVISILIVLLIMYNHFYGGA